MGEAFGVQFNERGFNVGIDPSFISGRRCCCTGIDHLCKCRIGRDTETVLPYRFC
jgi:hypothetical protein